MSAQMKVRILASTRLYNADWWDDVLPYQGSEEDIDYVAEFAGRACYQSFDRPNPATAENVDYLRNILAQNHHSVLEHGHVVLYVEHVSRSLLAELTRHRHLSFSVESQRYVDVTATHPEPIVPPVLRGTQDEQDIRYEYSRALNIYRAMFDRLTGAGAKRKKAREAARAVLPNSTPVNMVVSGNLRAWRDVLGKRHHVAADAEIQEFALAVIEQLAEVAPNALQDIPTLPYGSP